MYRQAMFLLILAMTGASMMWFSIPDDGPGIGTKAYFVAGASFGASVAGWFFRNLWVRTSKLVPISIFVTTAVGGMVGGATISTILASVYILGRETSGMGVQIGEISLMTIMLLIGGAGMPFLVAANNIIALAIWLGGMALAAFVIRYRNPDLNP